MTGIIGRQNYIQMCVFFDGIVTLGMFDNDMRPLMKIMKSVTIGTFESVAFQLETQ